ncbi:S-methyl-5'-thioinosine phosphorylase [Geochorda subterranea]|uniref:Purine nucleoside phosphorylase n=1 Tax=Geochorda subterranea TaxID=3109564 RepID=A0ABZ1BRV3_9FIRM|nr:S-methyl-5'-thioinosine phosphorylase [Limnochorda sp. LNt]WRP15419.1 S-methyl-5'-thioinosine phosphorylase [Limnochorda sp. LNt]
MSRARLAVIGGTGFEDPSILGRPRETTTITTRLGAATVSLYALDGVTVAYLSRHGPGHSVPPHRIDYRANIAALAALGVQRVVATAAVGSLRRELPPGTVVVADQFLDFTRQRPVTFFEDDAVVHTDFSEPYCPQIRAALVATIRQQGLHVQETGCYVGMEGPRYETPAEVRALAALGGDVVGMTGLPEAVLAREAGICYAVVAVVTNLGAGLSASSLSHQEVVAVMDERRPRLLRAILQALASLPEARGCPCAAAPGRGLVASML